MARQTLTGLAAAGCAASLLLAPIIAHADQANPTIHVVQPGETLSHIAASAAVDADALARLNNLDDANFLVAGQSLKLPVSKAVAALAAPAPPRSYAIAEGDTLWTIAHQFST